MLSRDTSHIIGSTRREVHLAAHGCALLWLFVATVVLPAQQDTVVSVAAAPPSPVGTRLTLSAAVEIALHHNRHLQLAQLAVRDSGEQKTIAQSHFYPTIANQSSVLHITELEGVVIPAGAFAHGSAGLVPSDTIRLDQGASTTYTSGTGLTQPITQAFKIRAGVQAASADLNVAKIRAADAENAIALQVHQLYYGILIEQARGDAAEAAVQAAAQVEQENRNGLADGRLLEDAELLSRTDLLDKQQAVLVSRLALDDLMLQFDDALGAPLGTKYVLDPDALGDLPAVPSRVEAIALVLSKSPKILEARQTVEKAKAGIAAARDEYIPNVTGMARYSYQDGLPFFARNFGTFGAMVTYDLFNGGAREATLKDARIHLTMAETDLKQTEDDATLELSSAYDKVEQLQQLVGVATQALEAREETLRIRRSRAEATAELPSGVAAAQAAVSSARMNVLNARLNLYLAQCNLQRLLGNRPD